MSEAALHVLDEPTAAVAELLAAEAGNGASIVLTGGSAAGPAYVGAAALEPDWSGATVWWGDERCVPPGSELSNFGLAQRTLLDRLGAQPEVHRIHGELAPEVAAERYDEELAGAELDLLFLGLGPDGHVASLFPGSPQLAERSRRVTHGPPGLEPFVDRVTMTLPTLLSARHIVLLVLGPDKADAVAGCFGGEISERYPGSLLRTGFAPIDVYLDAGAAAHLG